jgi:hypothetical protein
VSRVVGASWPLVEVPVATGVVGAVVAGAGLTGENALGVVAALVVAVDGAGDPDSSDDSRSTAFDAAPMANSMVPNSAPGR